MLINMLAGTHFMINKLTIESLGTRFWKEFIMRFKNTFIIQAAPFSKYSKLWILTVQIS